MFTIDSMCWHGRNPYSAERPVSTCLWVELTQVQTWILPELLRLLGLMFHSRVELVFIGNLI